MPVEQFSDFYIGPAFILKDVRAIMPVGITVPRHTDVKVVKSGEDRSSVEYKDENTGGVRTVIIPNSSMAIDFEDLIKYGGKHETVE